MILTAIVILVVLSSIKYLKKLTIDSAKLASVLSIVYFSIQIFRVMTGKEISFSTDQIVVLKGPIEWVLNTAFPGVLHIIAAGFQMVIELVPKTIDFFKEVIG